MTDYRKLYNGISKVAWGYLFIYFDFKAITVSILPSFVGYLLFLSAITYLKSEESGLSLLRTLGVILALWHGLDWLLSWFSFDLDGVLQFADILICLINLYFHFQLLTNLASIAAKYQPEGYKLDSRLLRYRTIQTVILTAIVIITRLHSWLSEIWTLIAIIMLVVYLIACICLMKTLFGLRKCLPANDETEKMY